MTKALQTTPTTRDRARGSLIGLAVGDAVGAAVEFRIRGTFTPVQDLVGGGPHNLQPGEWTDDTIMAICLAESLLECRFNPLNQLERYVRWWRDGYNSPKGFCFDIGGTTASSLAEFERSGEPYRQLHDQNGGNGSLMRLAPIPITYKNPEMIAHFAEAQGMTTHASLESNAACRVFALALRQAIDGATKEEALSPGALALMPGIGELPPKIAAIVAGSYRQKTEAEIISGGYVVDSLEAALWSVWRAKDFREAVLLATNLGHDADTTAAIAGQLAGALWGLSGIPKEWRDKLYRMDHLLALADALIELEPDDQALLMPCPRDIHND